MFGGSGAWSGGGSDDDEDTPEWADADLSDGSDFSGSDGWGQVLDDEVHCGREGQLVSSKGSGRQRGGRTIKLVATLSIPFPLGSFGNSPSSLSPSIHARGSPSPSHGVSPLVSPRGLHSPRSPRPSDVMRPYVKDDVSDVSVQVVKDLGTRPQLVELDSDTDLNVPPPGWLESFQQGGYCGELTRMEKGFLTGALAELSSGQSGVSDESAADFIASSNTMKTLFEMPLSNANVSIAVHRVDQTLVLNGVVHGQKHIRSRFGFAQGDGHEGCGEGVLGGDGSCSVGGGGGRSSSSSVEPRDISGEGVRKDTGTPARRKAKKKALDKTLFSKFMYYSVSGSSGDGGSERGGSGDPSECLAESELHARLVRQELSTGEGEDAVFRRAVHFQFQDLSMLLGSDTVIFNKGTTAHDVSLRLEDAEEEVTRLTCLDYWLDNIFNNVQETAICYHKEGKVHGYQRVKTDDFPSWRQGSFSPQAIMGAASSVLNFLQQNCTRDTGTYWLVRSHDSDKLELYCLEDEDASHGQRGALAEQGAMLCYKIARRLQRQDQQAVAGGGVAKHRQRCGRLYSNVVSTLDERQHPLVVSVSHEGIGDAMVGTEWGGEKARGTDDTFYVDQHGDLVEVEVGGGEEGLDEGGEGGAKASVGDTATWGTAYSLGDLEVAMRHYLDAASAREQCEDTPDKALDHVKRARCKAAKCGVAIAMRMLKRGNVAAALLHSVKALGVGGSGTTGGREGQELASEAMEVWADAHTMLGKMSSSEVKGVQEAIDRMMVEERIVKTEPEGGVGGGTALTGGEGSPLAHPLSLDVEANSNHAIRYLIRALQSCNHSGRRHDIMSKLAGVYTQLGRHYTRTGRFTRAHQHYRQGIQLFESIGDKRASATLAFRLAQLFTTRSRACGVRAGLSAEQWGDLSKAMPLLEGALCDLEAAVGMGGGAKQMKALTELTREIGGELGDAYVGTGIGVMHASVAEGGGRAGRGRAEKNLRKALKTYERGGLAGGCCAHLYLASLFFQAEEGEGEEGDERRRGRGVEGEGDEASLKAKKGLTNLHLAKAYEGAVGLGEQARVACFRAEVGIRRGGAIRLEEGLRALLMLRNCQAWTGVSSIARWGAFDGGWGSKGGEFGEAGGEGKNVEGERKGEEAAWREVKRIMGVVLKDLALSHSNQRNSAKAERFKAMYRIVLGQGGMLGDKELCQKLWDMWEEDQ